MKLSRSGFTVVELVTVIAIIGVLATIIISSYSGVQAENRDTRRKTDIANIAKALEVYYSDTGAYPIPTGTTSTINSSWYSSNDSSWTTFNSLMTDVAAMPTDPRNNAQPLNANSFAYAYFSGSYCGKQPGQWYLLVYRYENTAKEKKSDGTCTVNELGDGYYADGASYYRVVR